MLINLLELKPFLDDFLLLANRGLHQQRILKLDRASDILVKLLHQIAILLNILPNMLILNTIHPNFAFKRRNKVLNIYIQLITPLLLFVTYVL